TSQSADPGVAGACQSLSDSTRRGAALVSLSHALSRGAAGTFTGQPAGAGGPSAPGGGALVSAAGMAARGHPPSAGDKGLLVRGRVAGGLCRAFVSARGAANAAGLD